MRQQYSKSCKEVSRSSTRDYRVELLRVIGCLIVIGVHTALPVYNNNAADTSRLFISCIFADGVAIFWMIAGFFLFGNKRYSSVLSKAVRHIAIPMILFSLFYFYLGNWVTGEVPTPASSIFHTPEEYKTVASTLLTWSNPVAGIGHLWYLYAYLMVMAAFPIINSFVQYLDEDDYRQKVFIGISLAFFVINDITGNKLAAFSHHSLNAAIPASIEMVWGHILYKHRENLLSNRSMILGLIAFILLNAERTILQRTIYPINQDTTIMYWYSSFGILCAAALCVLCLSLPKHGRQALERISIAIGSLTFSIYLFHVVVRNLLNNMALTQSIQEVIFRYLENSIFSEMVYSCAIVMLVFLVTGAIIIAYRILIRGIKSAQRTLMRGIKSAQINQE